MLKIAVFVSGSGTDLQCIIDAVNQKIITAEIALVVGSKSGIYALERATIASIPSVVFDKNDFDSNEIMFDSMLEVLKTYCIDFIVLAGYLNILTKNLVANFPRRIINIHPSLIPKYCGKNFYGMKVHEAVLNNKEKFSGATVHYVDEGTDTGEIILQEEIEVLSDDTPASLQKRVLALEHTLLPKAINLALLDLQGGKMKKRALISVSDKTNIEEVCKKLDNLGYEIISTGGTYNTIKKAGLNVLNISEITSFPECLDGRVKTLHPSVHAGLLAMRSNPVHMKQLSDLNINTIDVVIVNLYPFKQTIMKENIEFQEAVENIDIGGPTMLRSAAKNFQDVIVIVDPNDYERVFNELEQGEVSLDTRKYLMYKVYQHTAVYDTMISTYLRKQLGIDFPTQLTLAYEKVEQMRYGENPHQMAASYSEVIPVKNSLMNATKLNGKQLSYNNINDANGAIELLKEFNLPTIVAIKHANPCGVSSAENIYDAYMNAYNCDPVSIFGGIVASNRDIDLATAKELIKTFLEIIIAPDFSDEALAVLKTKPNLRVLKLLGVGDANATGTMDFKKCYGGLIMQTSDVCDTEDFVTVTQSKVNDEQRESLLFAMNVVKHCKSNAIVLANGTTTLGIGVGQTNRIWATNQSIEHSLSDTKGAVLASDAFFPFSDCVEVAAKNGISAIIQPGGSIRDQESIDLCDKYNIAMVMTNVRHFKH